MLLGNDQSYSKQYFNIETSLDKEIWEMAVDKRDEDLAGWQEFKFTQRLVSFVKIIGTKVVRCFVFYFQNDFALCKSNNFN